MSFPVRFVLIRIKNPLSSTAYSLYIELRWIFENMWMGYMTNSEWKWTAEWAGAYLYVEYRSTYWNCNAARYNNNHSSVYMSATFIQVTGRSFFNPFPEATLRFVDCRALVAAWLETEKIRRTFSSYVEHYRARENSPPAGNGKTSANKQPFLSQTTSTLILIYTLRFEPVFECFSNVKKWISWIWKNQNATSFFSCFWCLFLIQHIYLLTFEYIHKLPKVKNSRVKSKSKWFGKKKLPSGEFSTIFQRVAYFCTLPRTYPLLW